MEQEIETTTITIGDEQITLTKKTGFQSDGYDAQIIEWWESPKVVIKTNAWKEYYDAMRQSGLYPDGEGGWTTQEPPWWNGIIR